MCPIFLLQNSLHPSGHTVQCAHSSADVHFYLWLTVRLFSCRWYYYYKTKTIYSNVPFRSLEERVNGQAAQSLTAQAEVTSQVATLAESTTTFDEKIAAFMRNIRGDFRCTREELVGVMEERVQLALDIRPRQVWPSYHIVYRNSFFFWLHFVVKKLFFLQKPKLENSGFSPKICVLVCLTMSV